jgi:tetratricopeptide (TPR) repeat protein
VKQQFEPDTSAGYFDIGVKYSAQGRYREAMEAYKKAIRIELSYEHAYFNLGAVYTVMGKHTDAVNAFVKAINSQPTIHFPVPVRLDPDSARAYRNLSRAYGKLLRFDRMRQAAKQAERIEAVESLKREIASKPDDSDALRRLGNLYYEMRRREEAVEVLKQAIRLKPDFADAHKVLGDSNVALGRLEDAVEAYKQAIRLKPEDPELHNRLAAAYSNIEINRTNDAIEAYKESVRLRPTGDTAREAYANLGAIYHGRGQYAEAVEYLKQAVRLDP